LANAHFSDRIFCKKWRLCLLFSAAFFGVAKRILSAYELAHYPLALWQLFFKCAHIGACVSPANMPDSPIEWVADKKGGYPAFQKRLAGKIERLVHAALPEQLRAMPIRRLVPVCP